MLLYKYRWSIHRKYWNRQDKIKHRFRYVHIASETYFYFLFYRNALRRINFCVECALDKCFSQKNIIVGNASLNKGNVQKQKSYGTLSLKVLKIKWHKMSRVYREKSRTPHSHQTEKIICYARKKMHYPVCLFARN